MSLPHLVESHIKTVLNYNLNECHEIKTKAINFLFNMACLLILSIIIGVILYYKYKGSCNIHEKQKRENKKRDYILYNLRKFQNIKNNYMTNISFE